MVEMNPYVSEPVRPKTLREDCDYEELELYWKNLEHYF
jgi:hypothetical protein